MSEVIMFTIAASYTIYITVCRFKYKLDKSVYICDALLVLAVLLALMR